MGAATFVASSPRQNDSAFRAVSSTWTSSIDHRYQKVESKKLSSPEHEQTKWVSQLNLFSQQTPV